MSSFVQKKLVDGIKTIHKIFFQDAININKISSNCVQLIVTSPPYWEIKDYGHKDQIGYNNTLNQYLQELNRIWRECIRVLDKGCKLCINIGDVFLSTIKGKRPYQIIPLHSYITSEILNKFSEYIIFLGMIIWNKVSTSNTSGGGHIMGSIYYPRNGYFFTNREYILIFRKKGKDSRPGKEIKELSKLTLDEWQEYFKDTWNFSGTNQNIHDAMFPYKLPKRLIKMYSFVGDIILDPFLGSGTTVQVASDLGRNSIGFEIGFNREDWKNVIKEKVESGNKRFEAKFVFYD